MFCLSAYLRVVGVDTLPLGRPASMAAELCVPGCLLCQFRPCPFCRGDALCDLCWTDLQDILWLEDWEADSEAEAEDDDEVLDGAGGADGVIVYTGTSTTCPPTDDSDVDIAEAASPDV